MVRDLYTYAHYRFRQRLLDKSREYPWCKVEIVEEDYTSITCGRCGVLNKALGGKQVYDCLTCGTTMDRDANGARNIFLKWMSKQVQ